MKHLEDNLTLLASQVDSTSTESDVCFVRQCEDELNGARGMSICRTVHVCVCTCVMYVGRLCMYESGHQTSARLLRMSYYVSFFVLSFILSFLLSLFLSLLSFFLSFSPSLFLFLFTEGLTEKKN